MQRGFSTLFPHNSITIFAKNADSTDAIVVTPFTDVGLATKRSLCFYALTSVGAFFILR